MSGFNFSQKEEEILSFWQKNKIYQKTLKGKKKNFSFYDGPPFATGKPHYGHILASSIKDTVCRFFSQRGHKVERRVGWDCHGLPVETLIEKELGIRSKKEIEKLGIRKFNQACRQAVTRHVDDFVKVLTRLGRWADYKNAYYTMDNSYIETVWWVLKEVDKLGLLYKHFKVTGYCPRCGTPLSNFEVSEGYREVKDKSIYVLFKLKGEANTYFLVWTTTPWTLSANLALAIGDFRYVKIKVGDKNLILAEERLPVLENINYKKIATLKKEDLLGSEYEPLYPQALNLLPKNEKVDKVYQVYEGDFVNLEEGTGIVHIAPAFGEDDMELGRKNGLPVLLTVDEEGKSLVEPGKDLWIKEADEKVIADLQERSLLFKEEKVKHSYPYCWRCETPLLYYPVETYYVKVSALKEQLLKNNEEIHWLPHYLKHGRFGKWLAEAKDWAISRNRYWGAPLPIWECETCHYQEVIGSVQELKDKGAEVPKDLHRPDIDKVTYSCPKCQGLMKRVPEVFDCWFESGSMPYAHWHYPFENKSKAEKSFPADFIAEGLDQTRGWFYTLHVLAAILTLKNIGLGKNKPAFKNAVVNGIILAEDGKKLSKRLKNYPDPQRVFDQYGADSLRFFLLSSAPLGQNYRFSERLLAHTFRNVIIRFYNCYLFLDYTAKTYKINSFKRPRKLHFLDKWIIALLEKTAQEVVELMENYELVKAARKIEDFIAELSLWYVRRVKSLIKDKNSATAKLYILSQVLKKFSILSAPFLPYLSEIIFQKLREEKDPISVHLCQIETTQKPELDVLERMELIREAVSDLLELRSKAKIKVRQPLAAAYLPFSVSQEEADLIKGEVNVKEVNTRKKLGLDTEITPALKKEGFKRELVRQIQSLRKKLGYKYGQNAVFCLECSEKAVSSIIKEVEAETNSELRIKKGKKQLSRFLLDANIEVKIYQ